MFRANLQGDAGGGAVLGGHNSNEEGQKVSAVNLLNFSGILGFAGRLVGQGRCRLMVGEIVVRILGSERERGNLGVG